MKIIISLIIACIVLPACQSFQDQAFRPATEQEILELNVPNINVCGTFEFASGTSLDECTETYTITSESLFIITDRHGRKRVAEGPLKIEASHYINFDEPMCINDFGDYRFLLENGAITISDDSLCDLTQ